MQNEFVLSVMNLLCAEWSSTPNIMIARIVKKNNMNPLFIKISSFFSVILNIKYCK